MRFSLARLIAPLSCVVLLVPVLVSARVTDATTGLGATGQASGLSTACSGSASDCIATMLGRIFNVLFGFLGIVLLGYIIYGGFVWMTADGSKDVSKAQEIIRNAVIGVIIIACSFAVSSFVIREVGQIAGTTDSSSGAEGGTGATGDRPTLDQLMDGAIRQCCYGAGQNGTPALDCQRDCQRTPTSFGLTTGATADACLMACGARICPREGPAAGQQTCQAGGNNAPVLTPGQTQPGQSATQGGYSAVEFCRQLDVEAGVLNPARDACRICSNGCLSEICGTNGGNGRMPAGMGGAFPVLNSQSNANFARQRCETTVCLTICSREPSPTLGY